MFKYMIFSLFIALFFGLQASDDSCLMLKNDQATAYGLYRFAKGEDGSEFVKHCLLICRIRPSGKRLIDEHGCNFNYKISFKGNNEVCLVRSNDEYTVIVLDKEQDMIKLDGKNVMLSLSYKILERIKDIPTHDNQFIHLQTCVLAAKAQEIWDAQRLVAKKQKDKDNCLMSMERFKKWFD